MSCKCININNEFGKINKDDEIYYYPEKPTLTIGKKWSDGNLVTYPVSYIYNGGIVINGKWYKGIKVKEPDVPRGYMLKSIGIGLQLNAQPPIATSLLIKVKSELGQQLMTSFTYEERQEMIHEIEENVGIGKLNTMNWNKLSDEDLANLHLFATVKCGLQSDMSLLGADKEINGITKSMEDQILKG